MRLFTLLFVFVALGLSLTAAIPACTSFVYVNGINTSPIQAARTVTDLLVPQFQTYLGNKGRTGDCYSIHLFYNASVLLPFDFAESARLFLNQDNALDKFRDHNELFQSGTSTEQTALTFALTTTPASHIVDAFANSQVAGSTEIINRLPSSEQTTTGSLVTRLLTEINAGHAAVCVGHSEGNFYCNLAYKVITEDNPATFRALNVTQPGLSTLGLSLPDSKVLQIIGIAEPADFVADGRNQYLTDCQDPITAVPNSLLPNHGTCVSSWRDSFWKGSLGGTVIYWLDAIGKLFINSALNFKDHRIDTYLTDGTDQQTLIMQMLERSLRDSTATTYTYSLDSATCSVAWVTSVFDQFGQHDADMRIGGWGDWYYSLFKCNFGTLPAGATKAELRFYKYPEGGVRSQIYLDRVTSPWDNSTKWPNKPTSVNLATLPPPIDGQWFVIDITDLFNGWQNGSYAKHGILFRPTTNANDVHNTLRSSEYADAAFRPKLVVTYTAATAPSNTPPTITLSGANPTSLALGAPFVEPGYSATDAEDGNITAKVTVTGTVNTATPGTYTLTYNVTDSAGAAAVTRTRTVTVLDASHFTTTIYPLTSGACSVVWVTSTYYGGGQHDADMRVGGWGDWYYALLKCSIAGPANGTTVRLRLYEYPSPSGGSRDPMYLDRVTGPWDNTTRWATRPSATNIRTLPAPVDNQWFEIDITDLYAGGGFNIMLRPVSNSNVFNFFRSTEYSDPAFRPQLVVTSASSEVNTAPVITLNGPNPVSLTVGSTFVEPGYTATDKEDGNITASVRVSSTVKTSTAGTYAVTYNVTDSGGSNASPAVRAVIVFAPATAPLTGSCAVNGSLNPIMLQIGTNAYFGAGASGGTGVIHYLWTGATGGDTVSASQAYSSPGTYTVSVRLSDSGSPPQQVTAMCPQVTISSPPPLSASCSINPNSVTLGTATTMAAAATGGYPPYTYQFPNDNGFGTSTSKSITVNSIGTFSYVAFAKDSYGSIVTTSPCSVTVSDGALAATNAVATPNPVKVRTNLLIQVWGSNFISGTTQVSLLGPGCLLFGSCLTPVTVVSNGYLESRLTVTNPGTYTVWLRNGSGNWVLAPALTLTVSP